MEANTLKAAPRDSKGTKAARRLRASGKIPAIIYGHKQDPVPVSLDAHEVEVAISHGAHLLKVSLDGKEDQYLIKEIQRDYRSPVPVHLDLMRVSAHEKVTVTVPIELRGTPKGVAEGGVLEQLLPEVEVECTVTNIPEPFHPFVTELGIDDSLEVRDLEVPPGVTINHEPDEKVAIVRVLAEEPEVEEGVEEEEAQPEVISRAKEEGEEESESSS